MDKKALYLIDATAFCYRAFYALPRFSTSLGQPTNAIYGFINILNKILKEKKPEYLAICFDVSRDTFRQKKFAEYKIQRPAMPDDLSSQMPLIRQVISAYRIPVFQKEGFEADDIIATMAKLAKRKGISTVIVSSDKDILQLVDEDIHVFSPHKDEGLLYDRKKVVERFGVEPERITDIMALTGDAVDNIPGVPGVGEKTALRLISDYGSLESLLNSVDKLKQGKLQEAIKGNIERINLNKDLVTLNKDVDIDFSLDELKPVEPDYGELSRLFKHLEFKRFLKDLPQEQHDSGDIELDELEDKDLKGILGDDKELVLSGLTAADLVFHTQGKSFKLKKPGDNLKSILRNAGIKKTGHDLKKIKVALAKEGITLEGLCFDTMIAAYLLNPSRPGYSLEDIVWDYLDIPAGSTVGGRMAPELITRLRPVLEKELREKSLFSLFGELEMPLVTVLAQMEIDGIKLDLGVIKKLSSDIEKRLIKLIEDIYDISGSQFNINSPKQLREILFEKLKLPVIKKSKTGPSTDEEVLKALADKHKLPALLLEYRQLMKLKTTYVDIFPGLADKETQRIHTSFNQTGTETGRLSSSNPNLQNIPIRTDIGKNLRRAIVSSGDGNYLLSCDYSQIELRILAHLSKDESLITAFKKDGDVHRLTASLIYGLTEADVDDTMREAAKRVNFGIVYGLTSYGLSRDLGIYVEQAQGFIDAYFLRYPKVKEYIQEQIETARRDGFVTTLLGRRRYIPEINNKNQGIRQFAERQAVNTPIQGSASDLIKLAMVKIHEQIRARKLQAQMILQVHDELVFDVSRGELAELADLVKDRMENVLELSVPVRVDMKYGQNWLELSDYQS